MRRVSSGQTGEWMINRLAGELGSVPFRYFGDWTDRIAKGELPKIKAAAAVRASSATSSSRHGNGPPRNTSCTI